MSSPGNVVIELPLRVGRELLDDVHHPFERDDHRSRASMFASCRPPSRCCISVMPLPTVDTADGFASQEHPTGRGDQEKPQESEHDEI